MGEAGGPLTVIYSAEYTAPKTKTRPATILPLLVILFIVSYGILTMLVIEQGQTIESQRSLIREMFKDSTQLAALKGKLARDDSKRAQNKAAVAADQNSAGSGNATQGNAAPGASGTKTPEATKPPSKSTHSTKEIPGKPAADLEDVRRSTRVI